MNQALQAYYNKLTPEQKKVIDNFIKLTQEQSDDKEEACHEIRKSLLKRHNLSDPWPNMKFEPTELKARNCQHFRKYLYLKNGEDEWDKALDSPSYNPGWMKRNKFRLQKQQNEERKTQNKAKWASRRKWMRSLLPGRKKTADDGAAAKDVDVTLVGGKPKRKYKRKRRKTRKKRRTKKRKTKRRR